MRNLLLLTTAALVCAASPAAARDGSGYLGIEGGVLFPRDWNVDADVDFENAAIPGLNNVNVGEVGLKTGYDLDVIAGYDFGSFRLEAEVGYKRAKADDLDIDPDFLDAIEDGLDADFSDIDLELDSRVRVLSIMGNALVDFGKDDGVSFYAGAGFGRASVKAFGEKDSAWAGQLIAGLRTAISENVDLGLKYRFFRTGKLDYRDQLLLVGDSSAIVDLDAGNRFRSHNLLASLIFNFGAAAAPPPPPPPPAPPAPPPPPATRTCPDGSVILATDSCPLPPPPPPPPPPAPERG